MPECVFCNVPESDIIAENELALAFDRFPQPWPRTHSPKAPRGDLFRGHREEQHAMNHLLSEVKRLLDVDTPMGITSESTWHGRRSTIFHLHVHLIPRYTGDVPDPRGGVRNIKPALVPYPEEERG